MKLHLETQNPVPGVHGLTFFINNESNTTVARVDAVVGIEFIEEAIKHINNGTSLQLFLTRFVDNKESVFHNFAEMLLERIAREDWS